jgi:hypothetical protein
LALVGESVEVKVVELVEVLAGELVEVKVVELVEV